MPTFTTSGKCRSLQDRKIDACIEWVRDVKNEVNARSNAASILEEYHQGKLREMTFLQKLLLLLG